MKRSLLLLIFVLSFCFIPVSEARNFALLVGVNEYVNIPSLKCCVNDIMALKGALLKIGFAENDIKILVTGGSLRDLPTKENIEQKVSEILASAKSTDMVFFAFSGHGARENNTDYFCPPFANHNNIAGTCVSITKVMNDLANCEAQFKWMVVDACRNTPSNSRDVKAFRVIPSPPAGMALFQSCSSGEKSYEEPQEGGNGYFTKNLVAALSGKADANRDGYITLLEVCTWTTASTKAEVDRVKHEVQSPYFSAAITDFPLNSEPIPVDTTPADETPSTGTPSTGTPSTGTPAAETPAAETPAAETPAAETPAAETPAAETPADETPADAAPAVTTPSINLMNINVPDDIASIEEAYAKVKDGGVITIQPGKYELSKKLEVNRTVTFCGSTGRAEDVVISCPSSDTFKITGGSPSFKDLTVISEAEECGCFDIVGGTPKLSHCIIISRKGIGIGVAGERTNPKVESCILKNCCDNGVVVGKKGLGEFIDCDIYENGLPGIAVADSGNPTFTNCKIHNGKSGGIVVVAHGRGVFNDCEIYGNELVGIEIRESGNPTFTNCKIHNGKKGGVLVVDNGLGKFQDCDIYEHALTEFTVKTSGNPTVKRCKIHDGEEGGLWIYDSGLGEFIDCEIYGNALPAIEVSTSGNPTVTGCRIHDGKQGGVFVHDQGKGTFTNNILENNYTNGKLDNWDIRSNAGTVTESGNTIQKAADNQMNVTVPDDYTTIEEAYDHVKDGGVITILPGKYKLSDALEVNREVTFRGSTGQADDVVIDCPTSNAFHVSKGSPSFQNITVSSGYEKCGGFYITGGSPKLFHCIITSRNGGGLYVQGENANPKVESCIVKNCLKYGIIIDDNSLGTFVDCDVYGNELAGIVVHKSSNPTFTRCKIHDGNKGGVLVFEEGLGKFNNCEIYGNALAGVDVSSSSNPTFIGCKIYNGEAGGVLVYDNGRGEFRDCIIYGNEMAGVEVKESANPVFTRCKIHSGKASGVFVCDSGLGEFNYCEVYENEKSGFNVCDSGDPTVANCIIHDGNGAGVYVYDSGLGKFKDCDIYGNRIPGFMVSDSANPVVTGCKIHDGKAGGVFVFDNGRGEFRNCEIYRNAKPGIAVKSSGNPTVVGCKIHDGKTGGVYVYEGGRGTFNNNTVENNYTDGQLDNWDITSDAGEVNGYGNTPPFSSRAGRGSGGQDNSRIDRYPE